MPPDLVPCSCGGMPIGNRVFAARGPHGYAIYCPSCETILSGHEKFKEGLIALWNEAHRRDLGRGRGGHRR